MRKGKAFCFSEFRSKFGKTLLLLTEIFDRKTQNELCFEIELLNNYKSRHIDNLQNIS